MVTMESFAQAFGFDAKSNDTWTTLGKVESVSGNTLNVKLGGSSSTTPCEAYCVAGVGDIVFVVVSNGSARAVARKGGDGDGVYLPLTGGELSGTLKVKNNSMIIKRMGCDSTLADNGLSSDSYLYHGFHDKNNLYTGWCGNIASTNGSFSTQLAARKTVGGSNVDNVLYLGVDKNGTRSVAVTDYTLWVAALKLNTWTSVTASDWITAGTGLSTNANTTVRYNAALKIVQVRLQLQATSAITSGGHTLGTIASDYRPSNCRVTLPSLTNASYPAYIDTNGTITANTAAVSANGYLYYCGEYHIGG